MFGPASQPSTLCPSCDPDFANRSQELYNPATPLAYRPQDPFTDKSLMRYMHLGVLCPDITPATTRLLQSRARRHRVHPSRPSILQRYSPKHRGWLPLPPLEYILDLIRVVHDATGHSCARTTTHHMSRLLTWPGLHEDYYRFCMSCDHCQLHADSLAPARDPHPIDLYGPFEHVLMDS